jgi:hypothetical protein
MTSREVIPTRLQIQHNSQALTADEGQHMRKIGALIHVRLARAEDNGADNTRNTYRTPQQLVSIQSCAPV